MAFIEASLEELPVSAKLGQSCLATKISAPGPINFGWFCHSLGARAAALGRTDEHLQRQAAALAPDFT